MAEQVETYPGNKYARNPPPCSSPDHLGQFRTLAATPPGQRAEELKSLKVDLAVHGEGIPFGFCGHPLRAAVRCRSFYVCTLVLVPWESILLLLQSA